MGPTQDKFLHLWQLRMLITGQPDKMHRDLRNNEGSTELSTKSMWIMVSLDNQYVSNLVISRCISDSLAKVKNKARSRFHCSPCSHFIAHPAHTSLLTLLTLHCSPCSHFIAPLLTLLAEATITWRLVTPLLNAAFRQFVPLQILFSITPGFVVSYLNQYFSFSCRVAI